MNDSDDSGSMDISITSITAQEKTKDLSRESSSSSLNILQNKDEDKEKISTPQKENSFRPLNFPTSPEFTPPPRIRTPLPGIVPERPAPYETELQEQEQRELIADEEPEERESKFTWLHILIVFLAVSFSFVGALYTSSSLPGMKKTEPSLISPATFNIDVTVNSRVFGQPQAVTKVLETLRSMAQVPQGDSSCRVILFAGGPGVGKDYLVQIIKDHFYKVGGSQCKEQSYLSLNTKKLNCIRNDFNIFSFETVYSLDDSQVKKTIITLKTLMRDCKRNKNKIAFILPVLTVKAHSIASLNLQGVDSFSSSSEYWQSVKSEANKLKQMLEEINLSYELVRFKPLSWSHVKMCITESAQRQAKAALSQDTMDDVLNLLLSTTGTAQDFVPVGCKDVDSMIAVLPQEN